MIIEKTNGGNVGRRTPHFEDCWLTKAQLDSSRKGTSYWITHAQSITRDYDRIFGFEFLGASKIPSPPSIAIAAPVHRRLWWYMTTSYRNGRGTKEYDFVSEPIYSNAVYVVKLRTATELDGEMAQRSRWAETRGYRLRSADGGTHLSKRNPFMRSTRVQ